MNFVTSVTLIGTRGGPEDVDARFEAIEVRTGPGPRHPEDVLRMAVDLMGVNSYTYRDTRRHTNWGATGAEVQQVEILFALAVGAQITASVLLEGLKKVVEVLRANPIDSADAAWMTFEDFLIRSFKVSGPRLLAVSEVEGEWKIAAEARGRRFEGRVSRDGLVVEAKRVDYV